MYQSLNGYSEYSVFCMLIGISLFEIFSRIKMKDIKVINYISSSTFIIYLLHDNIFIRTIWKEKNWIEICYNNFGKYIGLHLVWLVVLFCFGILVYTLYSLFVKLINSKRVSKVIYNTSLKS